MRFPKSISGKEAARKFRRDTMRTFSIIAVIAALSVTHTRADESFPTHTVKLVVPAASGSTTDTIARLIGDQLSHTWNKPVVVENISVGGNLVGSMSVFHSPPDGYTLLVSPPGPITFNHLLYRDLAYNPLKFVPVSLIARVPNALVVKNDLPATNVRELIAYAKANPGKLSFGSQGAGSTAYLSAIQLEMLGGVKMVHVPYRGAMPALNDVIAGHIDMFFDTLTTSVPMYRGAKVKILAVGSAERSHVIPEVPSIAESGFPGFRSVTWFAIVAPPGTSSALVEKINRDVVECLRRPAVKEKLQRMALEPLIGTPADAAKFFAAESALWGSVITENKIKVQ
jgi:tripartite-type tricarboxylate transporter receptor subunit TctC